MVILAGSSLYIFIQRSPPSNQQFLVHLFLGTSEACVNLACTSLKNYFYGKCVICFGTLTVLCLSRSLTSSFLLMVEKSMGFLMMSQQSGTSLVLTGSRNQMEALGSPLPLFPRKRDTRSSRLKTNGTKTVTLHYEWLNHIWCMLKIKVSITQIFRNLFTI